MHELIKTRTGVTGLVTLKNLREEGFDAQCFESSDSVGGVWSFSEREDETTILQCEFTYLLSQLVHSPEKQQFPTRANTRYAVALSIPYGNGAE